MQGTCTTMDKMMCKGMLHPRAFTNFRMEIFAAVVCSEDLIKIYFDFRNDFCVSVEFGSYAARNMFP
jgi:hypothetical protein